MIGKKIQKSIVFIISFFAVYFSMPLLSQVIAEDRQEKNECFAIGTGAVVKGNLPQAKKNAIRMALLKGVESYLVRLLGNQTVASHFESLAHNIIPNLDQEIENFHILAEQQVGTHYNVFVKMKVNENGIAEKLRDTGIFQTINQSVKVLFMVSETRGPVEVFWWQDAAAHQALTPIELALHGVFQNRGFNPVNRIMDLPPSEDLIGAFPANIRPEEALKWGKLFSAEVVIYGKSLIHDHNLILSLKALDVRQGTQICEKSELSKNTARHGRQSTDFRPHEKVRQPIGRRVMPLHSQKYQHDTPGNATTGYYAVRHQPTKTIPDLCRFPKKPYSRRKNHYPLQNH